MSKYPNKGKKSIMLSREYSDKLDSIVESYLPLKVPKTRALYAAIDKMHKEVVKPNSAPPSSSKPR